MASADYIKNNKHPDISQIVDYIENKNTLIPVRALIALKIIKTLILVRALITLKIVNTLNFWVFIFHSAINTYTVDRNLVGQYGNQV